MSFFTSSLALTLASALDISGQDKHSDEEKVDDFSAIQKELLKLESKSMVVGVVAFRIKSVSLFPLFKSKRNVYTTIINRNYTRKSRVLLNEDKELVWNDIHHFPVNVVQDVMHPFNIIKISLMGFSAQQPLDKIQIGHVMFHLYDIIKAAPISGTYFLWNNNSQIGLLDVEITFSYGKFGYGYSYQIKEEDSNSSEKVNYSLFPRINPPFSHCEKGEAIQEFKWTNIPHLLKSVEPIEFEIFKELKPLEKKEECYYPSQLVKDMNTIHDVKNQYFSNKDRVSRLMFLANYLSNARNVDETVFETMEIQSKQQVSSKSYLPYVVPTDDLLAKQKLFNNPPVMKKTAMGTIRRAVSTKKVVPEDDSASKGEENPKDWKFINLSKKIVPSTDGDNN